ncbi:MAG: HRDC domain-containing protein, partial [Actinomycetota bacterium]|nr:HRDC domain-containing protein [Actinomycetota bacterium]
AGRAKSGPASCRVCGRPLLAGAERKLRRCLGCPAELDDALYERLRSWRLDRARELSQPAFCVFTDATLTAIAEAKPTSVAELVAIPGIGQRKLDSFGSDVLALVTQTASPDAG